MRRIHIIEYFSAKKLIEETPIMVEAKPAQKTLRQLKKDATLSSVFSDIFKNFERKSDSEYKDLCILNKENIKKFREKTFDKETIEKLEKLEEQYENGDDETPIDYEGKALYEMYKKKLKEEESMLYTDKKNQKICF